MDISAVDEVLSTTRAVRRRLDLTRPVEREVVLDCLRLAVQAPTASNDQNWRWMVVTDPDKRSAIAEIYRAVARSTWPTPPGQRPIRRPKRSTRAHTRSARPSLTFQST